MSEVVQHPAIDHGRVDERGITEVKVGTRKLFEVFLGPRRFGFGRTKVHLRPHSRNGSQVDVRVDQARNKKLSLSRNYRCAGRLRRRFFSVDANDASIFDQHTALLDVIELLWRNDAYVSNPGSVRCLVWGRLSNGRHRKKRRK